MNITDDYIVSIFYDSRQIRSKMLKKFTAGDLDDEIVEYLNNRFSDSLSLKETLYRIKYKIEIRPVCKTCGGPVTFVGMKNKGFNDHCCKKCTQADNAVREKYKKTCMNTYGEDNPVKTKIIQDKMKSTTFERYGVDNAFKSETIKNKIKKTLYKKYGVENPRNAPHVKARLEANERIIVEKRNRTKLKNKTFNTSTPEEDSYMFLCSLFSNVFRQYKSDQYPFFCDFYIQDIDTYVELNCHWTHGNHPFDDKNENDREILNWWKSKNTKFYNLAIDVWTNRDVQKRNVARKNNLKFLEFWTFEDLKLYFDRL